MSKVKVTMRADSWGVQAGQQVEVESAVAEQLVADGHADKTSDLKSKKAAD